MVENIIGVMSPIVSDEFRTTGQMIISRLSFPHIVEIMTVVIHLHATSTNSSASSVHGLCASCVVK